jgi:hypothetical protein
MQEVFAYPRGYALPRLKTTGVDEHISASSIMFIAKAAAVKKLFRLTGVQ